MMTSQVDEISIKLITQKIINPILIHIAQELNMRNIPSMNTRNIKKPNINPVPTWRMALSPQVFLKSIPDSLMASFGDFS